MPTRHFSHGFEVGHVARPQRVVVVGAGIAGLVAAFELTLRGHDVTALEARMRPGGRIHTLRDQFSDGLYAEAGAYAIGNSYELIRHYIGLFKLPVDAGNGADKKIGPNGVFYLQGKRFVVPEGKEPDWPYSQLTAEERKLGVQGLWNKYAVPTADPGSAGWPDASARELDGLSVTKFLEKRGASEAVMSVLGTSELGEVYDYTSALQDLGWERFLNANETWFRLHGGNDQLPKAFAQRLGNRVRYGSAVQAVTQDKEKVRLAVSRAGQLEQVEADRVILAVPFSVLRTIQLDDSFSAQKRMVISNLRYDSMPRVYLQSRSRFWTAQGISGYATTDLPIKSTLDHTEAQPGVRAILGTETSGPNARVAAALAPEDRVAWALKYVSNIYPEIVENFEGGSSVAWDEEPWSRGGLAYYGPGEMTSMFPDVATIEGRVHFAGEHTSPLYVLEGAAQSGLRAAREIDEAA
jgi:monoamine oxidase